MFSCYFCFHLFFSQYVKLIKCKTILKHQTYFKYIHEFGFISTCTCCHELTNNWQNGDVSNAGILSYNISLGNLAGIRLLNTYLPLAHAALVCRTVQT